MHIKLSRDQIQEIINVMSLINTPSTDQIIYELVTFAQDDACPFTITPEAQAAIDRAKDHQLKLNENTALAIANLDFSKVERIGP
jgi:hypothetical protein